jgi:hypothetical protein
MGESFDSSWIMPSFRGALLVRLVIVGTIVIIVPLIAMFLFYTLSFLTSVFNPAACISVTDDIVQVAVVPTMPLATLLLWTGSTTVAASSIAWRRLTCALTSSISLGRWG